MTNEQADRLTMAALRGGASPADLTAWMMRAVVRLALAGEVCFHLVNESAMPSVEQGRAKSGAERSREYRERLASRRVTDSVTETVTERDEGRHEERHDRHVTPSRLSDSPSPSENSDLEGESPQDLSEKREAIAKTRDVTRDVTPTVTRDVTGRDAIPLPGHTGAPWRPLIEPIRNAILDWAQNRRVAAPKEAAVGNEGAAIVPIAKWLWETGELQGWTPGERIDRCRWLVRERFYGTKDARTQAKGYPLAWLAANPAEYALDAKRGAA